MPVTVKKNPRIKDLPQMLQLDAADMRRLTLALDRQFVKNEKRLFASEGASGGGRWAPLSPDYAERKTRMLKGALSELRQTRRKERGAGLRRRKSGGGVPRLGTVDRILQLSGSMADSLRERNDSDHVAEWKLRTSVGTIRLGTKHELAAYHAGGGSLFSTGGRSGASVGGLPVRDPIQMTTSQGKQFEQIVSKDLRKNKLGRMTRALRAWRPTVSARAGG